mgnify:CR=1 FL=1
MIDNFDISIKRWEFTNETVLRITVSEMGIEHHFQHILPKDDFISRYDQIWDFAKREILRLINEVK